jgi:hypothetical protein
MVMNSLKSVKILRSEVTEMDRLNLPTGNIFMSLAPDTVLEIGFSDSFRDNVS